LDLREKKSDIFSRPHLIIMEMSSILRSKAKQMTLCMVVGDWWRMARKLLADMFQDLGM
jgi:hypothetical protein